MALGRGSAFFPAGGDRPTAVCGDDLPGRRPFAELSGIPIVCYQQRTGIFFGPVGIFPLDSAANGPIIRSLFYGYWRSPGGRQPHKEVIMRVMRNRYNVVAEIVIDVPET
jgi:hypothetical protein